MLAGAGAGGSSAAYYLKHKADESGFAVDITIFERNPYVGGRSTTVDVFDNPAYPIELGASIFVEVNRNLVAAAKAFGLETESATRAQVSALQLGVWNGEEFVAVQKYGSGWWDVVKLFWRYGLAPLRVQSAMKSTVQKFLRMYEAPHFPFRSLTRVAQDVELIETTTGFTGRQFLETIDAAGKFAEDIVQASTRVNYGQNLELIHGLETMVCMATDGAVAVVGGNWQIFEGMINASGARIRLNTSVSEISESMPGHAFTIKSRLVEDLSSGPSHLSEDTFDEVILAAPFQFADLKLPESVKHLPDNIPYVSLHVTLFASPHLLSPKFFNLQDAASLPDIVLTTLHPTDKPGSSRKGVGSPGFWSISTLQTVAGRSPLSGLGRTEYVYKVFSPSPLNDTFLSSLLGLSTPADNASGISQDDITWRYDKVWDSYPFLYPRVTFEDVQLAKGIWYTSGIESFISTMETSSLMGANVAALIVNEWVERRGAAVQEAYRGEAVDERTEL